MQKLYTALLTTALFILFSTSSVFAQVLNPCGSETGDIEVTYNPPPNPDGSYDAGSTVEICVEITNYVGTGANWLHGFVFDFPPGWDESSVVIIDAPDPCGAAGGEWMWIGAGINGYGPGFYYDANTGGPQDNDPSNNFGDTCPAEDWDFCIEVTLGPPSGDPGFCGGPGNPLNGASIAPTVGTTGDGDTGSWGTPSTCIPFSVGDAVTMNCCDAVAGVSPGTLNICENGTICLFDELLGTPDPGGFWTGPIGWVSDGSDCGNFDPTSDPAGEYTYTVFGTGGCTNSAIINMEFIDLGLVANIAHCDPGLLDLNTEVSIPEGFPLDGTWYDPNGNIVILGLVDPNSHPPGQYCYEFYDASNCFTTACASVLFSTGSAGGCETWIDLCTEDAAFIPFDHLDCNPAPGGNWIVYRTSDNAFLDFISVYNDVLNPADYTEDIYLTYVLGAPPCAPSFTDLHVTIYELVNPGIDTEASICVTDPPVDLVTLMDPHPVDGPADTDLNWITLSVDPPGQPNATNPLNPANYQPNTTLQILYEGGLPNSLCVNSALLTLTILPADANAGLPNTIDVCETDPPFEMIGFLQDDPAISPPEPQTGGDWTDPNGNPFGEFFTPGLDQPGTYTYTVTSSCDSDVSTLTINQFPLPDAGNNNAATVCETAGNVDLTSLLGGTPLPGGTWTEQGTGNPVANPYNVSGQCGPSALNFVYTVSNTACTNSSTLALTIECPPNAGSDFSASYCADGSTLNLFTVLQPDADAGGVFAPSSTVVLNSANSGVFTYTVGSPTCGADVANYTINIIDEITVTGVTTICDANAVEYITEFTISGGTPPYTITGNNGGSLVGNVYTSNAIAEGIPYNFNISDSGPCNDATVSGVSPVCPCLATANFTGGNQAICAGDCTNLPVTAVGTAPFTVTYFNGVSNQTATLNSNNEPISVCPANTTTYSIVSVEDANCVGTPGNTTITVSVEQQPDAGVDVALDYCGDGSPLNLNTVIDPSADPGGTWTPTPNITLIPGNSGVYTYTVTGGGNCPSDAALYTLNIDPEIVASVPVTTCTPDQLQYIVEFNITSGVGPYTVTGNNGGQVVGNLFTSNAIDAGTAFNFTVSDMGACGDITVAGLSPNCVCTATSAITSGNDAICLGECTNLEFTNSNGVFPFTVEYTDGTNTFTETFNSVTELVAVCPTATTTYSITSVSDANCVGNPSGTSVTVSVETPPNAGPDVVLNYCGDGSALNLNTVLDPGADLGGTWTPQSIITLNPAAAGNYTYTVSGVNCPADAAVYTINIEEELSTSNLVVACEPSQTEYTVVFNIAGGDGNGSYTVTGMNGGTVTGNLFESLAIPSGTPYSFDISSTGDCPDITISGASPNCSCAATATFASGNTTICEGGSTTIDITTSGTPPFVVGISDGTTTSTINIPGTTFNYTVNPLTTTTYTLVSVDDANCTGSAFGSVTVSVETPVDAGPDVIVPPLCGDGSLINLNTYLDPAADLGGGFTPTNPFPATPANAGVYTYTVSGTFCPNDDAQYTVSIDEEITVSNVSATCEANQTEYVVTFEISGGTGPGTYDVTGVNGGTVVGNLFTSNVIPMGTGFNFSVDDLGPCPAVIEVGGSPNCNCAATANITSSNETICSGSCTDIIIESSGTPPFNIVYNDGVQDITINTSDLIHTLTVCPLTTTTYSLVSVEDANCVGSALGTVTISVDQQLNAGSDVPVTLCGDGSQINLFNYLAVDAEPGGTFSVPQPMTADPGSSGVITYTVGGNACPDDVALYTVIFEPEIEISNLFAACDPNQLEYSVQFDNPGLTTWTVTGMGIVPQSVAPGGTFDSGPIVFAGNENYSFTISDGSSCPDLVVADLAPDCNCIAQGSLNGTTTICTGECAQIELVAIGDGPFDITYENSCDPGNPTTVLGVPNGHIITVCPGTDCTYTLTSIFDQYCEGTVNGSPVTVSVDQPIVVNSVNEVIDNDNENYQVVINLSGGDPTTYNFFPPGGIYDNISQTYTSAPITCGDGYSITISDAGVCDPVLVDNPAFDCGCVSESGTIANTPQDVCMDGTVTVFHFGDEVMDGNDALQFILHEGTDPLSGAEIGRTNDGVFDMNNFSVVADQTYCIVAAVGTADFGGNVILNDPCTSFSDCMPVTIRPLPTATILGGAAVCPGELVDIPVQFTGTGPWTFEYALNGGSQGTITSNSSSYTLTVLQPGTYTLLSVSDSYCTGTTAGSATVTNYAIPTATMSGDPEVCENSGDGPVIEFTGVPPFSFEYSINGVTQPLVSPITGFSYVIPAEENGLFALVSLVDNNCIGTVSGNLNVTIIDRPTAVITGGGEVCDGDEAPFTVNFTGIAPWSANYTVDGVEQPPINSDVSTYYFDSGVAGDYELIFVDDDKCDGDILDSEAALIVNPIPTAELEASTTAFCIGEEIELGIILDGVPPFDVTYVLNNDTTIIEGLLSSTSQLMTPEGPVSAEILYVEDGSNPTCSSVPFSAIYVDAGTLPNAPVLSDDSLCTGTGPIRIGVTSAPGLTYQWMPEDNLDDPTTSNPLFTAPSDLGPFATELTYTLMATNGDCSAIDTMTIKVDPGPNARFGYTPDQVLSEDTEVHFQNYTIGSDNLLYYWEFDTLDTSLEENPIYRFPDGVNDSYDITLTVIDEVSGCMDIERDILTIQPEMLIYVPNAFTPDGDGLNDLWAPVMQNVDADNYQLSVFDRFGNLVFETNDVDQKWNGSVNGSDYYAKEGVYIWMIETKNSITLDEEEFKGKVTLIR